MDDRKNMGQNVREIAWHYYAGLKGITLKEAQEEFNKYLINESPLALSALRMAEYEVLHLK